MRKLAAAVAVAALVLVAGGAAADTFAVRLVSQTSSTITLGWDPRPGYGYLFSSAGVLRSRTNDAKRSTVKFSKGFAPYEVAVIVKGGVGTYPQIEPTKVECNDGLDNDGDGKTDYPADPDCAAPGDKLEAGSQTPPPKAQCEDGIDNDGDGKIDYPADPGCTSATDNDETNAVTPPPGCNLNATTANFAAQVSAATAGQTVCLASGNYGTWTGTSKAITIRAADDASPQMRVSFGSGDSGFTLEGMTGMGGNINGTSDVTVRNSTFTGTTDIEGGNRNLLMDSNKHTWNTSGTTGPNAKVGLGSNTGTLTSPSVTIRNSEFRNGDLDGIFVGGGSGYLIINNVFDNLCDAGVNHTDNIQFADVSPAVTQTRIAGNYVHATGCYSQGITSYDHGTNGVIIENNVVDILRPYGIELYSDVNSIVRHNTVVWHPASACFFNIPCGQIDITRKSADPAGTGTQVYDNIATVGFGSGSTGTAHHNVSGQTAVYVGPLTNHNGFLLSPLSPVGKGAASDGTDVGVYATG